MWMLFMSLFHLCSSSITMSQKLQRRCVHLCVCVCVCACVCGTSTTVFTILSRLSGYGSINIGLPPASPSNEEVEGVSECRS